MFACKLIQVALFSINCLLAGCWSDEASIKARYLRSISTVRDIQSAEKSYYRSRLRYGNLEELGVSGLRVVGPGATEDDVQGYVFKVGLLKNSYQLRGWPAAHDPDVFYSLYSDQTEIVRANLGPELATAFSHRIEISQNAP